MLNFISIFYGCIVITLSTILNKNTVKKSLSIRYFLDYIIYRVFQKNFKLLTQNGEKICNLRRNKNQIKLNLWKSNRSSAAGSQFLILWCWVFPDRAHIAVPHRLISVFAGVLSVWELRLKTRIQAFSNTSDTREGIKKNALHPFNPQNLLKKSPLNIF